jgi:hypothetical protein
MGGGGGGGGGGRLVHEQFGHLPDGCPEKGHEKSVVHVNS